MQRFATYLTIVLKLSVDWELFSNNKSLLAGQQKYWKTLQDKLQGPRGMLHCAISAKCVALLRQSLQKLEAKSTLCNAFYSRNVA